VRPGRCGRIPHKGIDTQWLLLIMTFGDHPKLIPTRNTRTTLGQELRRLRLARDELIRETAASLRIDPSVLSKYENGHVIPGDTLIRVIASHFRVAAEPLMLLAHTERFVRAIPKGGSAVQIGALIREQLSPYTLSRPVRRRRKPR